MSVLRSYAVRNLLRRRGRALLGILGVAFTLALLTCVQMGLDSLALSYLDLAALQAGNADALVVRRGGNRWFSGAFDADPLVRELEAIPEVAGTAKRVLELVQVSAGGHSSYAFLIAIDPVRENELQLGRLEPDPKLAPETCILSTDLARRLKAEAGGSLRLTGGTHRGTVRIEGVLEHQTRFPRMVRDYVVLSLETARTFSGAGASQANSLAVAFRDRDGLYDARDLEGSVERVREIGDEVAEAAGVDFDVLLPRAMAVEAFRNFSGPLQVLFGVFAIVALAVTSLLIYSILSLGVEERTREHAVLRTVGARPGAIVGSVLLESGILSGVGVTAGVMGGTILCSVVLFFVSLALGSETDVDLHVRGTSLLVAIAAGLLVATGGALVPALRAVSMPIIDALAPERRGAPPSRPIPVRGVQGTTLLLGGGASLLSALIFFVLPTAFLGGNESLVGAVLLGLLLLMLSSFTITGLALLPAAEAMFLFLLRPVLGHTARLTGRNLVRNRRRNTTTALMFSLSVSFVLFLASLVTLFSRQAQRFADHAIGADLRIEAQGDDLDEVAGAIGAVEDIEVLSRVLTLRGRNEHGVAFDVIARDLVGLRHVWIQLVGLDEKFADVSFLDAIRWTEGDAAAFADLARFDRSLAARPDDPLEDRIPPIVICRALADSLKVRYGDLLELRLNLGPTERRVRFDVVGVVGNLPGFEAFRGKAVHAFGGGAAVGAEVFRSLVRVPGYQPTRGVFLAKVKGSGGQVARNLRERLSLRYELSVDSAQEHREDARRLFWTAQVFFGLLLSVAVLISVFGLIAGMATSVMERRREIGILKALGLRRRGVFRMFAGEAVVLTLASGSLGGGVGYLLAYLFVAQVAYLGELPIPFTVPYLTVIAALGISLVAGLAAAYLPTRGLLRHTAAEILRMP